MNKYHGTVKEFLEAGHRFVEGDVYTEVNGRLKSVNDPNMENEAKLDDDSERYVVYAACLNKDPEPEYELVPFGSTKTWEAVKAVEEDGVVLCGDDGMPYLYPLKVVDQISKGHTLYRRIPLRTKTVTYPMPETKAPEVGTEYYMMRVSNIVAKLNWCGSELEYELLKSGNVFLKREHAQAKADAQAVEIEE